jgi:CRISPR-associated protein Cmr5
MPDRTIKSLENKRAEFALQCVYQANNKKNQSFKTDYKSYAKNIPVLIKTNGLGNTLAFMCSKDKEAYKLIYQQLSEWLKHSEISCEPLLSNGELLDFVISRDSAIYKQITTETLAFLNWLKRLAEGKIQDERKTKGSKD